MGPVLVLAVIAILAGFGWRTMRREHGRAVAALKKTVARKDRGAALTLEKDPASGVYRPSRRRERD